MDAKTLSQADYLDILYDNRNKKYGGYELRKYYATRMRKSMAIVVIATLLLCMYSELNEEKIPVVDSPLQKIITQVSDIHLELPKTEPPRLIEQSASKPTIENPEMKVVEDTKTTDPPKTVDELSSKESGPTTTEGNTNVNTVTNSTTTNIITEKVPPITTPVTWAEQMPEFNGDMNMYLQNHLHYPDRSRENGIEGNVNIRFVVNEDGSVSNVSVLKGINEECNAEAVRVISNMPKWKPGKQNGHTIKVFYSIPIRFVLQ